MRDYIAVTALALAASVTLTGCSADADGPQTRPSAPSPSPSATSEAEATVAPEGNLEAANHIDEYWHYGSAIAWDASGKYVVPGQPGMVAPVFKAPTGGLTLGYELTQVGQGADAKLAYVSVVSEASTDPLTPDEVVTYAGTIDPSTGKETSRHEVHRGTGYELGEPESDEVRILGLGSVVYFDLYSASTPRNLGSRAFAFDVDKGEIVWEREASDLVLFQHSKLALLREYADFEVALFSGTPCAKHSIVDLASGVTVAEIDPIVEDYGGGYAPTCTGPNVQSDFRFVTLGSGDESTTVDVITGSISEPWDGDSITGYGPRWHDKTSALVAYGGTQQHGGGPITVVDVASGAIVYEMPAETSADLSATIVNIFDGDLYLKTSNGTATIDLATGETVDTGWEDATVQRFDSGWTLDAGMKLHSPDNNNKG